MQKFYQLPVSACIAAVLNAFWDCHLSYWDVELALGQSFGRVRKFRNRVLVAKLWQTDERDLQLLSSHLRQSVAKETTLPEEGWWEISLRIALLIAIVDDLQKRGLSSPLDLAIAEHNSSMICAAWYAKSCGLPIDSILLCSHDSSLWELCTHGALQTALCPASSLSLLERVLFEIGGTEALAPFLFARDHQKVYAPDGETLLQLQQLQVSVASRERISEVISQVEGSFSHRFHPDAALCYLGTLNQRAKYGTNKYTLILEEKR